MNWIEARIEQIGAGHNAHKIGPFNIKASPDVLMISNRKPGLWVFSLFNGYRQEGIYKIDRPHDFQEGEDILIRKEKDKIVGVRKSERARC